MTPIDIETLRRSIIDSLSRLIEYHGLAHEDYHRLSCTRDSLEDLFYRK
jgi:hypothetical protein